MKLLIGLGNPGEKYKTTRHNAGAMFVDYIAKMWNLSLSPDKYFKGELGKNTLNNQEIAILKPQTYMNRSGESVSAAVSRFTLLPLDVYVAHDDLDLPLGMWKLQMGTGPKLHNGLKSIEEHWKTNMFWRVRIGVDNRQGLPISGEEYVLTPFSSDEYSSLKITFDKIVVELEKNLE